MSAPSDRLVPAWRRAWLFAIAGLCLLFLVLPIVLIVPMSFSDTSTLQFPPRNWSLRWYRSYFESVEWRSATAVSFWAALLTMLIATPIGTLAAWALRLRGGRFALFFWAMMMSPLIVPIILVGVGVFFLFARFGLTNTMTGLVAAHVMHALPFVFLTVAAGLKNFDLRQEMIARCLGASRVFAFMTVVLPQIRFSIGAAAFLAFMSSLDEVVIASFITGGDMATLPKRMFAELRSSIDPTIAAVSTLLIGISVLAFAGSEILQRRARARLGDARD
ncbi:ABC transporter permease [Allostella vacuolata]|nr:ABC transporter permease [Stella vacuolata]